MSSETMPANQGVSAPDSRESGATAWQAYWRKVRHFDKTKMKPWVAFRNAFGVAAPLAVCVILGKPMAGLALSLGALQVAYSDGDDAYLRRGKRMLATSLLGAVAVVVGGMVGGHQFASAFVFAVWAFVAGLVVALGDNAENQGMISLVTLIIYTAQPLTLRQALISGVLALVGGMLQTGLSLAFWPVRRLLPERRVIGSLYTDLSRIASIPVRSKESPPATAESTNAQHVLAGMRGNLSPEAERYRSLLNQAERIRLTLLALRRLCRRLRREPEGLPYAEQLAAFLGGTEKILADIGRSLISPSVSLSAREVLQQLEQAAESFRAQEAHLATSFLRAVVSDARSQMEALMGQFRSVHGLVEGTFAPGESELSEPHMRWPQRVSEALMRLRAELTLQSPAFRHALRLAVCVNIAQMAAVEIAGRRTYWLPMTVVLVLKPDFAVTFSRGLLRIAGTIVGLLLATAMFHLITPGKVIEIVLIGVFVFFLRWLGSANYGVFTIMVSAVIVLLAAFSGVPPKQVILARGIMTAAGGAIALMAYAVWPTWERTRISETLARLIDAYSAYLAQVSAVNLSPASSVTPGPSHARDTSRVRLAARIARTNMENSAGRLHAEPGTTAMEMNLLGSILASSHRFIHAVMAVEARHGEIPPSPAREALAGFTEKVTLTLALLARQLRGEKVPARAFPDLREHYHDLVQVLSGAAQSYELMIEEADRITNSVNTLREQIAQWIQLRKNTD